MKKSIIAITALLALVALSGFGQSIHTDTYDSNPAFRVKAGAEALSVTISSGGAAADMTAVIGSTTNTLDGSGGDDTVAELAALFAACTNSAGATVLTVDTDPSGYDTTLSTDGELLDGTYTAAAGQWLEVPWDTSDVKFYTVYLPDANAGGTRTSGLALKNVFGNPLGTGDVTLSVYLDGTLSWQALLPEVYAYSNNTETVALPADVNIPVGGKAVVVKAERATTATTGMLGIMVE